MSRLTAVRPDREAMIFSGIAARIDDVRIGIGVEQLAYAGQVVGTLQDPVLRRSSHRST